MNLKRILIVAGLIALFALTALSFLPGFNPGLEDYEDESAGAIGPLSYFKTPQTAVLTTSRLLEERDWKKLAQFYDQRDSSIDYQTLADGSYFRIDSKTRSLIRPFPPEYRYLEILGTEFEDVYEIVVGKTEADDQHDALQFFYLKRYPEGYRILANRPSQPDPGSPG